MHLSITSTIVLLISIAIASPANDADAPLPRSQPPHGTRRTLTSSDASRIYDRRSMNSFAFDYSPPSDFPPPSDAKTQSDDLVEALEEVSLQIHDDNDMMRIAHARRSFDSLYADSIIHDIREYCHVEGDRVFPSLTLTEPPTHECAKSIIASNEHFHIQTLNMCRVPMTWYGAHNIVAIVRRVNVLHLILSYCMLEDNLIRIFADALPHSSLTSLDLENNNVAVDGAIAIANALPMSTLTDLYLGQNYIGARGARAIADVLSQSVLSKLYLENNQIGNSGAIAIAGRMSRSNLTILDLEYNQIDVFGAGDIAASLPISKLTKLYLGQNFIGLAGARAFADVLLHTELSELFIGANYIHEKGANFIAEVLETTKLTTLDLSGNQMYFDGTDAIISSLGGSKMQHLDISENLLSSDEIKILEEKAALLRPANFDLRTRYASLDAEVSHE